MNKLDSAVRDLTADEIDHVLGGYEDAQQAWDAWKSVAATYTLVSGPYFVADGWDFDNGGYGNYGFYVNDFQGFVSDGVGTGGGSGS